MKKILQKGMAMLLALVLVVPAMYVPVIGANNYRVCLADLGYVDFGRYTGNMGDSCVFNLDKKGLPGIDYKYYRNGNVGVDGTVYENGFEVWIARWNFGDNISWAYKTIDLGGSYAKLTGSTGLIKSHNTTDFDSTVYFYEGNTLLHSIRMTPDNWEHDFEVDITGVKELKVMVKDNEEKAGGTSFALYDLFLSNDCESDAEENSKDEFQVDIYRANYLLNSETGSIMERTYIDFNSSPCKMLYDAGQEHGLANWATVWKTLTDVLDSVETPSKIVDYSLEEKDLYSAIIMCLFESSVDYRFMECIDNEIVKQSRKLSKTVTSLMKELYNLDVVDAKAVQSMTDKQKERFGKELEEAFEGAHGAAAKTANITKIISNGIKYGKSVEKICETIETCKILVDLADSSKTVLQKMYEKCPGSKPALKAALLDCIVVMDSGKKELAAEMTAYSIGMIGKDIAKAGIEKLWGGVRDSFCLAHPAAAACRAAYMAGTYVTDVCFNTDAVVEKYFALVAMTEVENVMSAVYRDVKNEFLANATEHNAQVYNSAVDVMFSMKNTDCDYALAYVKATDSSLASKLMAAFGDTSIQELEQNIRSIQGSTENFYIDVLSSWVIQLEQENIDEYYKYADLNEKLHEDLRWKRYNIKCPVDVYVYDMDENLVGSVVNNEPWYREDADITILVDGEQKTVYTEDEGQYNIVYKGNDTGTMDIIVTEYDEKGEAIRNANFNNLMLTDGFVYTSEEKGTMLTETAYTLVSETGDSIEPDYDSLNNVSDAVHTVELQRGYFADTMAVTEELHFGQSVEIVAYIPSGYEFAGWTSNVGEDIFDDVNSVTTRVVVPDSDVKIIANIVKKAGTGFFSLDVVNTIIIDGEEVDICRWVWTPAEL